MFTGIIEESGIIESIKPGRQGIALAIRAPSIGKGSKIGDSIAVNGCCLTITKLRGGRRSALLCFDLLQETWDRTTFHSSLVGARVNLERSLPANGRLGGHFVTGHIDGVAQITKWELQGKDHVLDLSASPPLMRYIISKGSVALDGISLTVASVMKKSFRVWIIPHTYEVTTLRERSVGDALNIETDLLGKYVERFVTCAPQD